MKHIYFLLLILSATSLVAQNKLSKLKTNETSIVFTSFPVSNLNDIQENTNSVYSFYQAYKMVAENDLKNRFSSLEALELKSRHAKQNNIVSLGVLNTYYEVVKPEAFSSNKIALDGNGFLVETENAEAIYTKNKLSIAAPLQLKHKGLNVVFNLSKNKIFNTTSKEISNIKIDFGNNEGFKTLVPNENLTVDYIGAGVKLINTQITFSDGTTSTSKSSLDVTYSNSDLNTMFNRVVNTFTSSNTAVPNLAPYGEGNDIGIGEYEIFLSDDSILDKPIFLVDGFDPGDGRPISGYIDVTTGTYVNGIYDLLNFDENGSSSNLGDVIRAEGYDVIILNFPLYTRVSDNVVVDGGSDFIERNAMLLVELIGIINAQKVGSEQNTIIGPSMGGLISRYALNFMENQTIVHDTRLWISFDSPHNGANVPIGFQYLFNKMAYGLDLGGFGGDQSVVALRPIVDGMLKSPAAKQMLVDHLEPHISSGTDFNPNQLPTKHPWSDLFFNGINALTTSGFPETTRNVSIINGSGIGNAYQDKNGGDILPNFQALFLNNMDMGSNTDGDFIVNFTPFAGQQNTTGYIDIDAPWYCFCDLTVSATVQAESFTDGVDAASGGLFDLGALSGSLGADPLINAFFAGLNTDYFNFIPAVSGMALSTNPNINWYQTINLGTGDTPWDGTTTTNAQTPFVNWYMPDNNEPHVTLTTGNVEFALDEILKKADLSAKIVLQGAALSPNTGEEILMRDDLRAAGLLPITSPYADSITTTANIFNQGGVSGIGSVENNIIDWIWVELRDANDNTSVIAGKSALLQRDGDIVSTDGISSLAFELPGTNYYVAIKHRNHLNIITSTPIALSRITTNINFSDANNPITFGSNAQTSFGMPTDTLAMWAGDGNGDGRLNYSGGLSDVPSIRSQVFNDPSNSVFGGPPVASYQSVGYNLADANMDGLTIYSGGNSDVLNIRNNIFNNPLNSVFGGPPSAGYLFTQQLPEN